MNGKLLLGVVATAFIGSGCATYTHLKSVKLVSFVDDSTSGKAMGRRVGKDCAWKILGYDFGTANITRAIDKARRNASDLDEGGEAVDYLINVSSETTASNYIVVSNRCYEVSGTGFMAKK